MSNLCFADVNMKKFVMQKSCKFYEFLEDFQEVFEFKFKRNFFNVQFYGNTLNIKLNHINFVVNWGTSNISADIFIKFFIFEQNVEWKASNCDFSLHIY